MKKLFKKLIVWAMRDNEDEAEAITSRPSSRRRNQLVSADQSLRSTGMTFYMYAAEGGTVIETSFYDSKKDQVDYRLYIIPDGDDFTQTLGQIVSMERIKSWH